MNPATPLSNAPTPSSTAAVLSLVFGILAWTLLPVIGSLVAIVTGHVARADIKRAGGALSGDGLALTGLILGWVQLAVLVLIVLFWIAAVVFFGVGLAMFGT